MTAPALNSAQFAPPIANASASAPAEQGVAGAFDALMAALFPQAPTPAVGKAQPAAANPTPEGATPEGEVIPDTTSEVVTSEAEPAQADVEDGADGDDEAAALAASLAGAQSAQAQPTATSAAKDATATPPAWGQEKVKGAPAQPAVTHADANADIAAKAVAAAESAGQTTDDPLATEAADAAPRPNTPNLPTQASDNARAAVQQAPSRQTAAATPPLAADAPVLAQPAAAQAASAAPTTDAAEAAPPPTTPTSDLPAGATAAAAAAVPNRTEAQAAQPQRPGRSDRKPEEAEGGREVAAGASASAKAATAKASDAVAKATTAKPDALEPAPSDVQSEADAPEAIQSAEARATSQSSAAAAHTAQPVRGSPETVAALAAQIVKKLEGKSTRFDVELDPVGLGKVDVRVEIGAHGRLVASLAFENPQAAQDLKARSGELQRALEQAGFDLSGGLSFDVAGDQRRQGQAWQEQEGDSRLFQGRAFRQALDTAGEADTAATQGALRLRRGVSAGLDLRI